MVKGGFVSFLMLGSLLGFAWHLAGQEAEKYSKAAILAGMVEVPGGEFLMGSKSGERNEKPVFPVRIKPFLLAKHEVTQGLWKAVMGGNPSFAQLGDDYPVEWVNWDDCQEFIQKLNEKTGLRFRLPSEAEWEYACRAGTSGSRYGDLDDIAWYKKNSEDKTHPVGQKLPNAFGLYDMLGNVWEWCQDWYGPYPEAAQENYAGAATGTMRIHRGGSWRDAAGDVRATNRYEDWGGDRMETLGFRLAADVAGP
ncbi:MAG TPA: formylglycine-generating enzyme family protein [Candidatus Aminicenantes bacterium]|nr:formylglycine-generating enzyme family protein [Candidatus Aminicenantes bacterium]